MTVTVYTEGATVNVIAKPSGPLNPTISNFTATPSACVEGDSVTFAAQVANAVTTTLNGAAVVLPATLVPPVGTQTFTLIATGAPGTTPAQSSVVVVVSPASGGDWFDSKPPRSITNMGTATLIPLNPCPSNNCSYSGVVKFRGIMAASGAVLVPTLGAKGKVFIHGGGHDDYYGNEVALFDVDTMSFSLLTQPSDVVVGPNVIGGTGFYHSDFDYGEHWIDAAGTATRQDSPSSAHMYGNTIWLPPGVGNNEPAGIVITTHRQALTKGGQRAGRQTHFFSFVTNKWARYSVNLVNTTGFNSAFIDFARNRVVMHSHGSYEVLDLNTRRWSTLPFSIPSGISHVICAQDPVNDIYVSLRPMNPSGSTNTYFWVVDPKTNAFTKPGIVGGKWPSAVGSIGGAWSEQLGGLVTYSGQAEKDIKVLYPPTSGNPRTTPWAVQSITFNGDTPPTDGTVGAGAHMKRFIETKERGGFLWLADARYPAQFWKL